MDNKQETPASQPAAATDAAFKTEDCTPKAAPKDGKYAPNADSTGHTTATAATATAANTTMRAPYVDAAATEVFVVADVCGFVGAYYKLKEAQALLAKFPNTKFIVYRYPLSERSSKERIYIIPYQGSNAIAFVSNDRAQCDSVRNTLASVDLTYGDDELEYWEHPVGVICIPAGIRLDIIEKGRNFSAADQKAANSALENLLSKLEGSVDGPMAQALKENERITIMDCVVPTKLSTEEPSAVEPSAVEPSAVEPSAMEPSAVEPTAD
jgi:hypothetical protein